jgi:hypothetical protein
LTESCFHKQKLSADSLKNRKRQRRTNLTNGPDPSVQLARRGAMFIQTGNTAVRRIVGAFSAQAEDGFPPEIEETKV